MTVAEPEFATNAVGCCGGPAAREGGGLGPDGGWAPAAVMDESGRRGEEAAGEAGAGETAPTAAGFAVNTSLTGGA